MTAEKCGGEGGDEARDRRRKGRLSGPCRHRCGKVSKSFAQDAVVSREAWKWCYKQPGSTAKTIDEEMDEERSSERTESKNCAQRYQR